jgi:hypothetical protein
MPPMPPMPSATSERTAPENWRGRV